MPRAALTPTMAQRLNSTYYRRVNMPYQPPTRHFMATCEQRMAALPRSPAVTPRAAAPITALYSKRRLRHPRSHHARDTIII